MPAAQLSGSIPAANVSGVLAPAQVPAAVVVNGANNVNLSGTFTGNGAGLTGVKTYLCRNYAKKGILTNIVHPCVIATELLKQRYADAEAKKKLTSQIPVGRLGRPEDVAGLVAFLASPWGDFICGQEIMADGGRTFYGK